MIDTSPELIAVLRQFNPWWSGAPWRDQPGWRRAAFGELRGWLHRPPAHRALLLSGARQVGKTTLLLQAIQHLIQTGVAPRQICYLTFDHPLLKLLGLDAAVQLWREIEPAGDGEEYLFLDEIQNAKGWQTWLKLQVDFQRQRRIVVTGSATPLNREGLESGVGRWHTLRLATLSFYEYLQIKQLRVPELPRPASLVEVFGWSAAERSRVSSLASALPGLFHDYLVRGGFPQCTLVDSLTLAQRLLREDIVDKVLMRDMTALYGVRRVLELEQTFLYLCLHDGELLDLPQLGTRLELSRPTVASFIDLLEASHLIYRLLPFGYGKEVLRGRQKIYLADAAISSSVMLRGRAILEDPTRLGRAVETAFFKHVFTRYYRQSVAFSYYRNRKGQEVDMLADLAGQQVPFEVKYRATHTRAGDLPGLEEFCAAKQVPRAYVITRELDDFGPLELAGAPATRVLKIPAALACYWLSQSEEESGRESEGE